MLGGVTGGKRILGTTFFEITVRGDRDLLPKEENPQDGMTSINDIEQKASTAVFKSISPRGGSRSQLL